MQLEEIKALQTEKQDIDDVVDRKTIKMGLGKLGTPGLVFVRKFRFTLESPMVADLHQFVTHVHIDLVKKTIDTGIYEIVEPINGETKPFCEIVATWLDCLTCETDELTFTTYDGCGESLYEILFKGVRVVEQNLDFDYSVSDASVQAVKFSYDSCVRRYAKEIEESNATNHSPSNPA